MILLIQYMDIYIHIHTHISICISIDQSIYVYREP